MNGEIIFAGQTSTFKDGGNITSVVRRIQQGELPGDRKGRNVIRFFEEHIRPILECSAAPSFFHEADIPKACAVFWNINCQFSYEKIDTRRVDKNKISPYDPDTWPANDKRRLD